MIMIFIDSRINHLQEVIGQRVNLDFDSMTGELYLSLIHI